MLCQTPPPAEHTRQYHDLYRGNQFNILFFPQLIIVTVITLNLKLLFVTGHLRSATRRDTRATSRRVVEARREPAGRRTYKTIVPDTRQIARDRPRDSDGCTTVNPVKVVPRENFTFCLNDFFFFFFLQESRSSFPLIFSLYHSSLDTSCADCAASEFYSSGLLSHSLFDHPPPPPPPAIQRLPPHPPTRAPYGGVTNDSAVYEYGLFGRDRCGKGLTRANALLSLRTAKKAKGRAQKRQGYFPSPRLQESQSFLSSTSLTTFWLSFSITRSTLRLPGPMTNADQGPQFNGQLVPNTIFMLPSDTFSFSFFLNKLQLSACILPDKCQRCVRRFYLFLFYLKMISN